MSAHTLKTAARLDPASHAGARNVQRGEARANGVREGCTAPRARTRALLPASDRTVARRAGSPEGRCRA